MALMPRGEAGRKRKTAGRNKNIQMINRIGEKRNGEKNTDGK